MESIKVLLNDIPILFEAGAEIIDKLEQDDAALIEYVCDKIREGQVDFLAEDDLPRLVIQRTLQQKCTEVPNLPMSKETTTSKDVWFHKGKPTSTDDQATLQMLELRASEQFMVKFADKKSVKLNLWRGIATKLCQSGISVDAEKCRQKFANLQKQYIDFVRHVGQTGAEKRDPPKFYDLMHAILGEKDKITLKDVSDSLQLQVSIEKKTKEVSSEKPSTSQVKETKGSHERPHTITKQDIFNEIKKQGEKHDTHIEKFCGLIEEQNKQRSEFIQILRTMVQPTSQTKEKHKKRRRSSSSDEN